ncbi:hypothetical protein Tco_0968836 [Tanacetum coccineum]
MLDSEDSTVTYIAVSNPFANLPDIRSPGVDGPPMMPEDPYAYVLVPFQAPPSLFDYVTGPEGCDYPAEEQPLPAAASPTTDSPGYVPESNPEDDLEEDDDEDPEEDPADRGDDDDDEDESSDDDEDEDVDIKGDEEEEEHLAPAVLQLLSLPAIVQALLPGRLSRLRPSRSADTPHILHPRYCYDINKRGHRLSSTREEIPIHYLFTLQPIILFHNRPDLLPSSGTPPLHLLSTDRRADRPEVTLPPRKRLGIALGPRYEVGESSSAPTARPPGGFRADYGFVATIDREIMRDLERDVGYGITDTWDEMLVDMPGAPATDDTELGRRMTEFTTRVRQDTYEIYTRLDDEQSERQLMAGRLNMLYRDRRAHARTARLMEAEARMSREAWGRSMDASDLARAEVMSLRTQVVAQQAVITELQAADRRRQAAITEMLAADRRRQEQFIEALRLLKRLQTQMTEFERQQGPAKGPAQPDAPEEAGSSS